MAVCVLQRIHNCVRIFLFFCHYVRSTILPTYVHSHSCALYTLLCCKYHFPWQVRLSRWWKWQRCLYVQKMYDWKINVNVLELKQLIIPEGSLQLYTNTISDSLKSAICVCWLYVVGMLWILKIFLSLSMCIFLYEVFQKSFRTGGTWDPNYKLELFPFEWFLLGIQCTFRAFSATSSHLLFHSHFDVVHIFKSWWPLWPCKTITWTC